MKAICVDDEVLTMEYTVEQCRGIGALEDVRGFTRARDALAWLETHPVDLALLDIDMPDMNGIMLAARIKELNPDTAVIFLTAYREFAYDAYQAHPSGYLLKPVTQEQLTREILYALSGREEKRQAHVTARTFGEFELLVDGEPVVFARSKSRELLAYLVDRQGGSVPRAAVFAVLFEDEYYDRSRQKYLDVIIRSLRDTLAEHGIGDILQMNSSGLRVCPEKLDCDLYRFFEGDVQAISAYRGEYMSTYSWASLNEAYLDGMRERKP